MLWWLRWKRCSASETLEDVDQQLEFGDHHDEDAVAMSAVYST